MPSKSNMISFGTFNSNIEVQFSFWKPWKQLQLWTEWLLLSHLESEVFSFSRERKKSFQRTKLCARFSVRHGGVFWVTWGGHVAPGSLTDSESGGDRASFWDPGAGMHTAFGRQAYHAQQVVTPGNKASCFLPHPSVHIHHQSQFNIPALAESCPVDKLSSESSTAY